MPSVPPSAVVGEWINDRYVVTGELGRGNRSTVYRAEDRRLGTLVALKFPHRELVDDPEPRERFEREVRNVNRLEHRAIVRILDVGQHRDSPFFVMPFLSGGSLADRMPGDDRRRLPAPMSVVGWLTEIAAALDFCHARGVHHGAVNPANILFDTGGNAFLSDVGMATAIDAWPEPNLVDDRHALAVVVYQALTGQLPHSPRASASTARPIREWRPDLSEAVATAVMRAFDPDLARRDPSCRAFANAIRNACVAEPHGAMQKAILPTPALEPPPVASTTLPAAELPAEPPLLEATAIPAEAAERRDTPMLAPESVVPETAAVASASQPPDVAAARVEERALVAAALSGPGAVLPAPTTTRVKSWMLLIGVIGAIVALNAWSATHRPRHTDEASPIAPPPALAKSLEGRIELPPVVEAPRRNEAQRRAAIQPLIRNAPLVPWPLSGASGYARARQFLASRSAWEATLGEFKTDVFASPAMDDWNATAARITHFVAEAAAVELSFEDNGPLEATNRRASIRATLSPQRLDLLQIDSSTGVPPQCTVLPNGRFVAELDLPSGVDRATVTFRRLDGTLLGAREVKAPVAAAAPLVADAGARNPAPIPEPSEPVTEPIVAATTTPEVDVDSKAPECAAPDVATPAATTPTAEIVAANESASRLAELAASFDPAGRTASDRRVWIHRKSGLRFVEVELPLAVVNTIPRFATTAPETSSPFVLLVAETECTNDAWQRWRPLEDSAPRDGSLPVVQVSGRDIVRFCADMGLELPYSAEWRYLALGGAPQDPASTPAALAETAWFKDNSEGEVRPARTRAANALGLFDVQGNVWEACLREDEEWSRLLGSSDATTVIRPFCGGSSHCAAPRCQIANQEFFQDGPGASRGFRPIYRLARSR